jgi:hypothetical protein
MQYLAGAYDLACTLDAERGKAMEIYIGLIIAEQGYKP